VHYNVGKVLTDAGLDEKGEAAYKEAIRLYPEYDQALNNLGNLVKESNRLTEAEMYLERALKHNNEFAAAWMNLGIVQAALNKTQVS
jgi:tetratricopeptide (TPR) repeat protein